MTRPTSGADQRQPHLPRGRGPNALIWRWWNLLLLLPFLMLITPWYNKDKPRLFGLPFFYWYQLAFVFVGVACVSIVYAATSTAPTRTRSPGKPAAGTPTAGRPPSADDADPADAGFGRNGVGR